MSADLYFHTVYDATASADSTVKVLGETPGDAVPYDEEIVVNVTVQGLKDALKFDPSWTVPANNVLDADTLPTVTWDPRAMNLAAARDGDGKSAEDRFLAKYAAAGTTATFLDDAGSSKDAMQKVISQCDPKSGSLIEKIPYEAIIKVTANGVVSDLLADILPSSANTTTHADDRMNLFEQALAAGKASEQLSGTSGILDFKTGDSITVYVKYSVHKKTTVELDIQLATGATKSFTLPDQTVITDGLEETGPSKYHTVAWKFVASS
jgi:hypothetical protein